MLIGIVNTEDPDQTWVRTICLASNVQNLITFTVLMVTCFGDHLFLYEHHLCKCPFNSSSTRAAKLLREKHMKRK